MTSLGTIKSQFRRAYVYTNPGLLENGGVWRDENIKPAQSDITGIYTINPIRDFTDPLDLSVVNLFFDINVLDSVNSPTQVTSYLIPIFNGVRRGPEFATTMGKELSNIYAKLPMKSASSPSTAVIWFDISALEYAEIKASEKYTVKTYAYNSSITVNLTATIPVVSVLHGNDTAELSFDATALNYV